MSSPVDITSSSRAPTPPSCCRRLVSLASIAWAILALLNGIWIGAAVVGVTWYFATVLASVLNPLDALHHAARRQPDAVMQLIGLRSLYYEIHGKSPELPDQYEGDPE